jgi:hypothetical protein
MESIKVIKTSYNVTAFIGLFALLAAMLGLGIALSKGMIFGIPFSIFGMFGGLLVLCKTKGSFLIKQEFDMPIKQ